MKKRVAGLSILLSLSLLPLYAATPIKAGSICTKVGSVKVSDGRKFTCKKSGKRLVWDKGVVVKKPKPSVTPTPISVPVQTPTPTPTPTPTQTPTALTFENISDNVKLISSDVFEKKEKLLDSNFQSKFKVNLYVGPNTKPTDLNPLPAITIGSNLMRNFTQPDVVNLIYYNFQDKEWAKGVLRAKDSSPWLSPQFDKICPSVQNCDNGSAGVTLDWEGWVQIGIPNSVWWRDRSEEAEIDIHEFVHTVQGFQFKRRIVEDRTALFPRWFFEGHATVLGKLGASKTLDAYNSRQIWTFKSFRPNETLVNFSSDSILKFYEALSPGRSNQNLNQYNYTLGYSTVEALSAIGGIDSPMDLYIKVANGASFEQAFKSVYGIEWKAAAPILAEVVSKQYTPFWP